MRAYCALGLLAFAVWYSLWFPPVRRRAEIEYPSDEALMFSESN